MTDEEKAYVAGIVDGEGSIMLIKFHKNQQPAPYLSIASISLELLNWIRHKTGLGLVKSKKNYKPNIHKDSYTYTARYNDAFHLIELIAPYLVIAEKKQKAQLILNEYKKFTPRNGRYSEELLKQKEDFNNRFYSI